MWKSGGLCVTQVGRQHHASPVANHVVFVAHLPRASLCLVLPGLWLVVVMGLVQSGQPVQMVWAHWVCTRRAVGDCAMKGRTGSLPLQPYWQLGSVSASASPSEMDLPVPTISTKANCVCQQ